MNVALLLFCVRIASTARVTQQQINVTLSLNETALIDPSSYFNYQFSEFNITHSDSPSAQVLPQLEVKEVSEAHTQSTEWRFGASVVTSEFTFFAVLYTHKLEVWRVHRHSLSKEWEVDAAVERVVGVSLKDAEGFAYWTHSNLYFIDLQQSTLSAREMRGVDISSASHVAVCSKHSSMTAVQRASNGYVFTSYSIDYATLTLEETVADATTVYAGDIIDILCTDYYFYLTSQGLFSGFDYVPVPASFGLATSLEHISNCDCVFVRAAEGVVLYGERFLMRAEVARVLRLTDRLILVQKCQSRWVVTTESLEPTASMRRKVLLDLESPESVLWLEGVSASRHLVAFQQGSRLKLLAISAGRSLLRVTGHSAPYRLTLCGIDFQQRLASTCVVFSISVLPESHPTLLLFNGFELSSPSHYSISHTERLEKRHYSFNFKRWLSGSNLELRSLVFPHLPVYFNYTCSSTMQTNARVDIYTLAAVDDAAQFLCAWLHFPFSKVALVFQGKIIESGITNSVGIDVGDFTDLACVYADEQLWVYLRDRSQYGKLLKVNISILDTQVIDIDSKLFVSVEANSYYVVLVFRYEVMVLSLETNRFQRISAKTEYTSASLNGDFLLLRTPTSLEYYEKRFFHYEFEGEFPISENIIQLCILKDALMTLDSDNNLRMFHVSVDFQLTQRYIHKPPCRVLYLTTIENRISYRCEEYLQLIDVDERKHAYESKRIDIPLPSAPMAFKVVELVVEELYKFEGKWTIQDTKVSIYMNVQSQVDLEIRSEYKPAGSIALEGLLEIGSSHSPPISVSFNLTLENYGAVITTTDEVRTIDSRTMVSRVVEVPWDEELVLQPRDWFEGGLMHFSVESSDPRIQVKAYSPLAVEYTVQVEHLPLDLKVALGTKTLFYCSQHSLVARKLNCENRHCVIASEHSIPLSELSVRDVKVLDVLCAIGPFSILRLFATAQGSIHQWTDLILSFDGEQSRFEALWSLSLHFTEHKIYTVQKSTSLFHIFFYYHILEHCIGTVETKVALKCSEVSSSRLVHITSVGSKQLPDFCWEVFVLTKEMVLFSFQLCEALDLVSAVPLSEVVDTDIKESRIVGSRLIASQIEYYYVYSLPDFTLVYKIPWPVLVSVLSIRNYRWIRGEFAVYSEKSAGSYYLCDLGLSNRSILLAKIDVEKFQFIGPNQFAGIANGTLLLFSISQGKVVIEKDESQVDTVETEVEITARNELSEATVRLRVVRKAKTRWHWAAAIVGIALIYFLVTRPKGRKRREEIELQALTYGQY